MNWFDACIVIVVGIVTWNSFRSGILMQLAVLSSAVVGILVAGQLYSNLSESLLLVIDDEVSTKLIAFLSITFGILLLGYTSGFVLRSFTRILMLGWLDRFGGGILGFASSTLIITAVLASASSFPASQPLIQGIDESYFARELLGAYSFIEIGLPAEFEDPLLKLFEWRTQYDNFNLK